MSLEAKLKTHRQEILRIAAEHGARRVRVFGSAARREETPHSDLDLLVDLEPGRSLLDHVGLIQDLEELLDCSVDVVVEGGIGPYLEKQILADALPL